MAKIFVTRKIPGDWVNKLIEGGHDVEVSEFDRPLTEEELLEKGKGVDALLTLLTDKIGKDTVEAIGPQLKIVSNYAVGYNNIRVDEVTDKGVVITNTPSAEVNESVAEHTWALMLALIRRIVEADLSTRQGAYKGWEPNLFLGRNMKGKTIGIVGMGRIGSMVAQKAKGWGVKVLYFNRKRKEDLEEKYSVRFKSFDDLLKESDFVTLHTPLTDETRHLMNKNTFSKIKKGAYLINTARGPIVEEHDLIEALRSGQLGGAGLDVFEVEPNIHPELVNMENVILTPHTASATWEARDKMGEQAVTAIIDVLAGKKPDNIVNDAVWEKRRK